MIILWALGAMWAVGTFGTAAYMLVEMVETSAGRFVFGLVATPIWAFVGLGPLGLIAHESGPTLATLLSSEWRCTSAHEATSTTYIMVGMVMVPSTTTSNVCDAYGRN